MATLGKKSRKRITAALKELLRFLLATREATPSELRLGNWNALSRVAKAQPWAGLANAFRVQPEFCKRLKLSLSYLGAAALDSRRLFM